MQIVSNIKDVKPVKGLDRYGNSINVELPISGVQKLDIANVTLRAYPRYTSNQGTIAFEKHLQYELQNDRNYVKDFYIDTEKSLDNTTAERYLDELTEMYLSSTQTAYDLAEFMRRKQDIEEVQDKQKLVKNRLNVNKRIVFTLTRLAQQRNEEVYKWKYNLKRLFHQMREQCEHILEAGETAKFHRLAELISQKAHITPEFLTKLPKRNSKEIGNIREQTRLLLSKKTDELLVFRKEHGDDFEYDEHAIQELTVTGDTASMLSERLTVIQKQQKELKKQEEEKKLEPFYDFKRLKDQWKITSQEQLKNSIRRVIVKQTLSEAEHIQARAFRIEQEKKGIINSGSPSDRKQQPIKVPKKKKCIKQKTIPKQKPKPIQSPKATQLPTADKFHQESTLKDEEKTVSNFYMESTGFVEQFPAAFAKRIKQ